MTKTSHDCIGLIGVSACVALLILSLPGCGEETTSEEIDVAVFEAIDNPISENESENPDNNE